MFDYEGVSEILSRALKESMEKRAAMRGAALFTNPKELASNIALGLGLMGGFGIGKKVLDDYKSDKDKVNSRQKFFQLHPEMKEDPEAWEMHDFMLKLRPEYGKAPMQMGKIIKNIKNVDHYITPDVFAGRSKTESKSVFDNNLSEVLGLLDSE